MPKEKNNPASIPVKERLLQAAFTLIRTKGYNATTLDELCAHAQVSKGSFFHYFKNKDDLAVNAAEHWSLVTGEFFASAPYHDLSDPLDRFLGYIEFRKEILTGKTPEYTCLVGTLLQETFEMYPKIKKACQDSIFDHAEKLEKDIRESIKIYKPSKKLSPKSLALHTQAVIQGAFILAKASDSAQLAAESLEHLKIYIQLLFNNKKTPKNV